MRRKRLGPGAGAPTCDGRPGACAVGGGLALAATGLRGQGCEARPEGGVTVMDQYGNRRRSVDRTAQSAVVTESASRLPAAARQSPLLRGGPLRRSRGARG